METGQDQGIDAGRIARVAQESFRSVYPGWTEPDGAETSEGIGDPGQRAVEAQVAAAALGRKLGRKPLYFDPWGEENSKKLVDALKGNLPENVIVSYRNENLFCVPRGGSETDHRRRSSFLHREGRFTSGFNRSSFRARNQRRATGIRSAPHAPAPSICGDHHERRCDASLLLRV